MKLKKTYIMIIILLVISTVTFYFSYAFFTNKVEGNGKLNIIAGTLDYKIESNDLKNNQITIKTNSIKKITIKLTSLNEIDSKYELFYETTNNDVEVGYIKDILPTGTINAKSSKEIEVLLFNTSTNDATVTFSCEGGFINNSLVKSKGISIKSQTSICENYTTHVWNYDYTGSSQDFITPCDGTYKIELWGAQGGSITGTAYNQDGSVRANSLTYIGGKGAYTTGNISLLSSEELYIYVGGTVSEMNTSLVDGTDIGGYNGGGPLYTGEQKFGAPGGGATDIRITSGNWDDFNSLKSRIMVAAGGGGANFRNQGYGEGNGGEGGTLTGINGYEALTPGSYWRNDYNDGYQIGNGATQTSGGTRNIYYSNGTVETTEVAGTFGGANFNPSYDVGKITQSGFGSGYYSGGSSYHGGAGGGSSFISGYNGCDAIDKLSTEDNIIHTGQANHYSGYLFTNSEMIAGNSEMPTYDGATTMIGNSGNGYAKITYLGSDKNYEQSFKYKLESTKLTNNKIIVPANSVEIFDIKITSLNDINSKYELYYNFINNSVNDVSVVYTDKYDLSTGIINVGENKTVQVIINNLSDSEQTIEFGVQGTYVNNNDFILTHGSSLIRDNNIPDMDIRIETVDGKTYAKVEGYDELSGINYITNGSQKQTFPKQIEPLKVYVMKHQGDASWYTDKTNYQKTFYNSEVVIGGYPSSGIDTIINEDYDLLVANYYAWGLPSDISTVFDAGIHIISNGDDTDSLRIIESAARVNDIKFNVVPASNSIFSKKLNLNRYVDSNGRVMIKFIDEVEVLYQSVLNEQIYDEIGYYNQNGVKWIHSQPSPGLTDDTARDTDLSKFYKIAYEFITEKNIASYEITSTGDYTFEVVDNSGNKITKTIHIEV